MLCIRVTIHAAIMSVVQKVVGLSLRGRLRGENIWGEAQTRAAASLHRKESFEGVQSDLMDIPQGHLPLEILRPLGGDPVKDAELIRGTMSAFTPDSPVNSVRLLIIIASLLPFFR